MLKTFDTIFCWGAVLGGMLIATLNVAILVPHNPEYHASWLKVGWSLAIVILGVFKITKNKGNGSGN